jgi:hypothetical protein
MKKSARTWSLTITSEATQLEMVNTAPAETVSVPGDNHKGKPEMIGQGQVEAAKEKAGATA